MTPPIPRVVFDCVIYAQAIISDSGPAAECLERVRAGELRLIWSDYVLQEIRELPEKLPTHLRVTLERVEIFILAIAPYVEHVLHIPEIYRNPFDPDDSHLRKPRRSFQCQAYYDPRWRPSEPDGRVPSRRARLSPPFPRLADFAARETPGAASSGYSRLGRPRMAEMRNLPAARRPF